MRIDLNADVGESFGAYVIGHDAALMRFISSANVAAGFHGGDPSVLRLTVRLAKEHGVAVGAHPGFADLAGFGRREMKISASEAEDLVLYQIAAVAGVAATEGVRMQHVKPHGALYNVAAVNADLAAAIARATAAFDRDLILFGPPDSELLTAGRAAGLRVVAEGFADRAYEKDGSLVSRAKAGAVIREAESVTRRAIQLATEQSVTAVDGSVLSMRIETICIHGDTDGADRLAESIRTGLEAAAISVRSIGQA